MEMTFAVYENDLAIVSKELDKLARKAERFNAEFSYHTGAKYPKIVRVFQKDYVNRTEVEVARYTIPAVDVVVTSELVKMNGWEVLARVERLTGAGEKSETKNMVINFTPYIDQQWYTIDFHCDHCGTKRQRSAVYICRNIDGREVQVGASCLKDYTGIDPHSIISWATVKDIFEDLDHVSYERSNHFNYRYYEIDKVFALACDIVSTYGYVKSDMPDSTKLRLIHALESNTDPSDEAVKKTALIIDWIKANEAADNYRDSIVSNMYGPLNLGYIDGCRLGYAAYVPVAYDKEMEKRRLAAANPSQHVGEIGKRIKIVPKTAEVLTSWKTSYGSGYNCVTTYLWKIVDENDNVFTWKTSNDVFVYNKNEYGDDDYHHPIMPSSIIGTVKNHTEFRGVKQTQLTRCKVVA